MYLHFVVPSMERRDTFCSTQHGEEGYLLYVYTCCPLFSFDWQCVALCTVATGVDKHMQRLLGNEKLNFKVLSDAVHKLGGVPPLMASSDMSNTLPDEKVSAHPNTAWLFCTVGYVCGGDTVEGKEATTSPRSAKLN